MESVSDLACDRGGDLVGVRHMSGGCLGFRVCGSFDHLLDYCLISRSFDHYASLRVVLDDLEVV